MLGQVQYQMICNRISDENLVIYSSEHLTYRLLIISDLYLSG